jgi:uncharacterized protein (DUF736 family)
MAIIGQFTRTPTGFEGRIRTLILDAELTVVTAETAYADDAPDYRVRLGNEDGPEVGAVWKRSGERAGTGFNVVFDDPTFVQPMRARLFQMDDDGRDWALAWRRAKKQEARD